MAGLQNGMRVRQITFETAERLGTTEFVDVESFLHLTATAKRRARSAR